MMNRSILTSLLISMVLTACGGADDPADDSEPKDTSENKNHPPVAVIDSEAQGVINRLITVSGINSSDEDQDPLIFQWSLQTPDKSSTQLASNNDSVAQFTPDVSGHYQVSLFVSDKKSNSEIVHKTIVIHDEAPLPQPVSEQAVSIQNHSDHTTHIPFTFATVFKEGDYQADAQFALRDAQNDIALQSDVKATYPDGSIRHAIFSGWIPELAKNSELDTTIIQKGIGDQQSTFTLSQLKQADLNTLIELDINNQIYSVDLDQILNAQNTHIQSWLSGPIVNEWVVSSPFTHAVNDSEHAHLFAVISIRVYGDMERIRVSSVIENNWAYQANPQHFRYDARIKINNQIVEEHLNLTHLKSARWRSIQWLSDAPDLHIKHDAEYLIDSKAVPSYDKTLINNLFLKRDTQYQMDWVNESVDYYVTKGGWGGTPGADGVVHFNMNKIGPMGIGLAKRDMPGTGGREDIGPFPAWAASSLLSQSITSKKVMLGMANMGGSWPIHFRDKNTMLPVSIDDYPYVSYHNDPTVSNAPDGKNYHVALCTAELEDCQSPYIPDTAHQPSLTYYPYLVTGDYFLLEELHFWANYNFVKMNPVYRGLEKGHFMNDMEDRGQAWSMRTLAQAAFITPDAHPMKSYFEEKLQNNIAEYHDVYVNNSPNHFGMLKLHHAISLPWQDDFFTWAIGHAVDLGYDEAKALRDWKSNFSVQRMGLGTDNPNDYCWIFAAAYHLVASADNGATTYDSIADLFSETDGNMTPPYAGKPENAFSSGDEACASQAMADHMTAFEKQQNPNFTYVFSANEMLGYSASALGFPSNLQIALATAVDAEHPFGLQAWQRFMQRSVKPESPESFELEYNYRGIPNFAIVPRSIQQQ